jgi:hypothetical protein
MDVEGCRGSLPVEAAVEQGLNDWGGGQFLVSEEQGHRVERSLRPTCTRRLGDRRPIDAASTRSATRQFPKGELIEIADSATLVPEDQPEQLAQVLTDFLHRTGAEPVRHSG